MHGFKGKKKKSANFTQWTLLDNCVQTTQKSQQYHLNFMLRKSTNKGYKQLKTGAVKLNKYVRLIAEQVGDLVTVCERPLSVSCTGVSEEKVNNRPSFISGEAALTTPPDFNAPIAPPLNNVKVSLWTRNTPLWCRRARAQDYIRTHNLFI